MAHITQIIGYQPFTRCYKQRGYFIDTAAAKPCWEFSLTNADNFTKSLFKRTPKLSKRIFEEFDGGNILFPKDSLFYFEEQISFIMKTKIFPEEIFERTYGLVNSYLKDYVKRGIVKKELMEQTTKDWIRSSLKEYGISFSEKMRLPAGIDSMIEEFNKKWNPIKYAKDEDIIAWGRKTIPAEGGFYLSMGVGGIYMLDEE